MKTTKKRKSRKKNKEDIIGNIVMGMFGVFILANIVLMVHYKGMIKEQNKFTEEDWEYMYEYIDEEFCKGIEEEVQ